MVIILSLFFFLFSFFQMDKEKAELARANFYILRKEAQSVLDLVGLLFLL
jgi:hypothetical protein